MGGFTKAADDDLYTTTDATLNISSSVLRIRASANDGFASISVNTIPYTSYTISFRNDPDDSASGSHSFKVGTTAGAHDIVNDLIPVGDHDTTISHTFNAGNNTNIYFSWSVTASGRFAFIDTISFKEA